MIERSITIRYWLALALIACMGLALVILDQFTPVAPGMFLEMALSQKHTLLLVLAAQAALIFVLKSNIADGPIPKTATIIAAMTIFAAELGQLDQSLPTGIRVSAVILVPIGIAITNVIPLPRTVLAWLVVIFLGSVALLALVWIVASTRLGLFLAIFLGGYLVVLILAALVVASFILIMVTGFGLLAVVQGRNTRPRRYLKYPQRPAVHRPARNAAGRGQRRRRRG